MGVEIDPIWKPDARGVVRKTHETEGLRADTSADMLLAYAFKHRPLAFEDGHKSTSLLTSGLHPQGVSLFPWNNCMLQTWSFSDA